MILLIDNYDSFTYNLYQYLCELGADVIVRRNDEVTVDEARALGAERLVISPGPCTPAQAGVSVNLVRELAGELPILGVCLGHQSVGAAFGAEVINAPELMHGKTSMIRHDNRGVFAGLPNPFVATRYHSLILREDTLPSSLEISARADDGVVMGLRHREYEIEGVQFHPESILTTVGKDLLANFIGQRAVVGAVRGY
jgi:anthranilate synthase/aminodeoxychorismate synthase-like glutamine amidotransferase